MQPTRRRIRWFVVALALGLLGLNATRPNPHFTPSQPVLADDNPRPSGGG